MTDRFRGRGVLMTIFLIPLFVSPVIVGQFWSLLLQRPFGPVDYLLSLLLQRPVEISWLTESPWNFIAIITADTWQWTPFMFVILLSGLTAIAPELYEAAALDGASRLQTFVHVTVPQLLPIMLLALTLRLLDAIKLFDIIYVMTGGGPGTSTYTTSYYLYVTGLPAVPPVRRDGRKLDLPRHHGGHHRRSRPQAAASGGRLMAEIDGVRRGPPRPARRARSCASASSR